MVKKESAILRPVQGPLIEGLLHQRFLGARVVGGFYINIPAITRVPRGFKGDLRSVGRPDRKAIVGGVEGEASESTTDQIDQPDVSITPEGSIHRNPAFVRRQFRSHQKVDVGITGR